MVVARAYSLDCPIILVPVGIIYAVSYTHLDVYKRQPLPTAER